MKLIFTPIAQEHWEYWKKNDPNITKRIKKLLADILEHPYTGIGKPEPLKYELAGKWSRRINTEHRLIYSVHNDMIEIYIYHAAFQQLNVKNPRFFHSLLPKPNPFFPTQKQCFPYSFLLKSSMINVAVQQ